MAKTLFIKTSQGPGLTGPSACTRGARSAVFCHFTGACFTLFPLCLALPLRSGSQQPDWQSMGGWEMNSSGDDGDGGGAVLPQHKTLTVARSLGSARCSMGMSCSRSSKLCTYWILLMNLTLAGGEGGTRLKASPWGGDSGSEGAMAARMHTQPRSRMPSTSSPKPPSQPMPDLSPCPWCGYRAEPGVSACKKGRLLSHVSDTSPC